MAQGNIVGEPFDDYVYNQITARQKLHGSFNRTQRQLNYLNSKTGWVKLTSGVIVNSEGQKRLDKLGISGAGLTMADGLNSRFVLFGGTYQDSATYGKKMFEGLSTGDSVLNANAYGLGGLEQGYRPMPGITSAETKFRNRGAIRDGSVNIKVWNRKQLEIIDILYLRLGFPMLLEWGHSIVIDSSGNVNADPNYSISSEFSRRAYQKDNDVLKELEKKREVSGGNYDGMYGRVQNFSFSYNKDGSYDVDLKLISIGAVVESLKANILLSSKDQSAEKGDQKTDEDLKSNEDWITAFKYSHEIGKTFFKIWNELKDDVGTLISWGGSVSFKDNYFGTPSEQSALYYVRFAELRRLFQTIIPVDPKYKEPILKVIKFNSDGSYNLDEKIPMYTHNNQISGDMRICAVGGFNVNNVGLITTDITAPVTILDYIPPKYSFKEYNSTSKALIGNLNNVYVNMGFVLRKMSELKNEKNEVILIDVIQAILDGINSALGGINTLSVNIIENTNELQFVDETPLPKGTYPAEETKYDNSPALLVQGYYNNNTQAGFIKDISIKTEISNQLASLITIGATANGSVVGEDATAFSKWNEGLEPIIKQKIELLDSDGNVPSEPTLEEKINKLVTENEALIKQYWEYIIEDLNKQDFDIEQADSTVEMNSKFLALEIEYEALVKQKNTGKKPVNPTSSKGFFPLNVSVTMDGLAGVKIYQKLKIDASFLPSNYPNVLDFIIKGVTHKIENNTWNTTIETVSVPKIEATDVTSDVGRGVVTANRRSSTSTSTSTPPTPSSGPVITGTGSTPSGGAGAGRVPHNNQTDEFCKTWVPQYTKPVSVKGKPLIWKKYKNGNYCLSNRSFNGLSNASFTQEYKKTTVVLHHTAGWPKSHPKWQDDFGSVYTWAAQSYNGNLRGEIAGGAPYCLNARGNMLDWGNDKLSFITQHDGNAIGIGIEIDNLGPVTGNDKDGWIMSGGTPIDRYCTAKGQYGPWENGSPYRISTGGIVEVVDWNNTLLSNNPIYKNSPYRGFRYAQEYTSLQIQALEKWIPFLWKKHGMKPLKWEGEKTFKKIFHPGVGKMSDWSNPLSISTHHTFNFKLDLLPTPRIVNLIKRLGGG